MEELKESKFSRPTGEPKCVVCSKKTDGTCEGEWVCLECFLSKEFHKWLDNRKAL